MILIDTNVISELMKPKPMESVLHWFDQQDNVLLFISSVSIAEIGYGLSVLPEGIRRKSLESAFKNALQQAFSNRILPFDTAAA
jgi:predicted nucleic acid-binding protein